MRSLLRYSLVALGLVALLTLAIAKFQPALERTAHAQNTAGSILVISAFRENGPNGTGDEFVEIFNPSSSPVSTTSLSDDPTSSTNGLGVFANSGNGTTSPATRLVCQIPGGVSIPGRGKFLCAGTRYSLSTLGFNVGASHPPDQTIGAGTAVLADIPNDAGLALIAIGTNVVTVCTQGSANCNSGFAVTNLPSFRVYDKVGFNKDGPGSPRTTAQPPLSSNFCEGTCLQPVGDASKLTSTTAACPTAETNFPITSGGSVNGIAICYGETGQYKISRRRATNSGTATSGDSYRDTVNANAAIPACAAGTPAVCGNADDFVLESPNPSQNIGTSVNGITGITSVLGAATPSGTSGAGSNPIIGNTVFLGATFDVGGLTAPRNAERDYGQDPTIANTANDPLGTFTLRFKFTNVGLSTITTSRFRIDDITTLCGGQAGTNGISSTVATQEARNLRGPIDPALTPVPSCQQEGSDIPPAYTAILKAVNSLNVTVVDSTNTARAVGGSILEDLSAGPTPVAVGNRPPGPLSPLGGGSNSTYGWAGSGGSLGDGVTGGTGTLGPSFSTTGSGATKFIQFKFGVVKSGRFKIQIQPEVNATPVP